MCKDHHLSLIWDIFIVDKFTHVGELPGGRDRQQGNCSKNMKPVSLASRYGWPLLGPWPWEMIKHVCLSYSSSGVWKEKCYYLPSRVDICKGLNENTYVNHIVSSFPKMSALLLCFGYMLGTWGTYAINMGFCPNISVFYHILANITIISIAIFAFIKPSIVTD